MYPSMRAPFGHHVTHTPVPLLSKLSVHVLYDAENEVMPKIALYVYVRLYFNMLLTMHRLQCSHFGSWQDFSQLFSAQIPNQILTHL